ncbi:Gfo/Idh/MocA family protein [Granulosicoccus antarcticus]|uniref:Scyllo-inositol 2-dehydrogenase (NADP(+)) n=1 Tax=Granulosicoccus antarcticus IMCC3135 TaxID=1192854 RepID=A0A2Z2NWM0_9GAMM|nr:Gfo/Idh/MocA family oxidoreductase [Granulosicoccus antarcticus]ASJ73230.1 scyllo-inositol 2-dehydrogenase (NADP(+)) [Granulosicoccus antarcticus IMCC3135]
MNKKYNLAVVGTNFIVPRFIDAAERSGYFHLHSIVSRKTQSGLCFRSANGYDSDVVIHENIADMLNDDKVDVVYLASPNAIHFPQAAACIKAGKHVIVEKPMTSNTRELLSLIALAKANNVLLMDAMKSLLCPNFSILVDNLSRVGRIRQCTSTYSKISSRYQGYLDGNNPNTFNRMLSNGSVMDLGVYCIHPFVHLFGSPEQVHAYADLLDSGVDAAGIVILKYPQFHVNITHSKTCATTNSSEIQGEDGTIVIDNISTLTSLKFVDKKGEETEISAPQDPNSIFYIAQHLGETISSGLKESAVNTHALSTKVLTVLDEVRRQTGVRFPADDR